MFDIAPAARALGTETAFDVLARAQALAATGRDIVNLGIGQPDFKTAEHIVDAAVKALRDGHHGYTPAPGIPALREAVVADIERRHDLTVDPDRVVVVPGGKVTIWFSCLMFGRPGVEIMYPDPGFPIYRSAAAFTGATPVPLPLHEQDGFALRAETVAERLTPRTRLLILNSPGNPTGGVMAAEEIAKLADLLADHPDVTVLSDEIYGQMTYGNVGNHSLLSEPAIADRVILLDGWSKTYAMTGWRLGYGIWPADLVEPAIRMAVNSHSCVSTASQFAGLAALTGPQDAVAAMMNVFDARRHQVVDGLNALPGFRCAVPHGAFYAFPQVAGTGLDAGVLQRRLLDEAGVALVPGSSFGDHATDCVRLSYAAASDRIDEGLNRIRAFLHNAD